MFTIQNKIINTNKGLFYQSRARMQTDAMVKFYLSKQSTVRTRTDVMVKFIHA